MDPPKIPKELKRRLGRHDAKKISERQFIAEFCKYSQWDQKIRRRLLPLLRRAIPKYNDEDTTGLEDDFCKALEFPRLRHSSCEDFRLLLCSAENITFQRAEDAMLKHLALQEYTTLGMVDWEDFALQERKSQLDVLRRDFVPKAKEVLKDSESWYRLSSTGYLRFYHYACHRLRELIKRLAREQLAQSYLGQDDSDVETITVTIDPTQDPRREPIDSASNASKKCDDTSLESERIASIVEREMLSDLRIDLTCHRKTLNSEITMMIYKIKYHYEKEVSAVGRDGHLPASVPSSQDRENVLAGLVLLVRHVYTKETGNLGNHEAFVRQMFRRNYGSLLLTGTHDSFDQSFGSACELTDMILGHLFPAKVRLSLPWGGKYCIGGHGLPASSFSTYTSLCLTSRRMRDIAQSVLMRRIWLDLDLARDGIDLAIAEALKNKGPLPTSVPSNLRTTNSFAHISRLRLSLPTLPWSSLRDQAHQ